MSTVPGSLFRKILFWSHLTCGIVAGVLIFVMSATGVAMTYERQMIDAAARRNMVSATEGQQRLSADELAVKAREASGGDDEPLSMLIDSEPGVPVSVSAGRRTAALLDPYTGAKLVDEAEGTRGFMSTMRSWHRYMGGDSRSLGGILIDYSNLLFVFIILSGIYLWLPAVWRWRTVRGLVLFQSKYINSKVRDFNWHHVFSVWMLIPLFVIAVSGVVMSFPWANNLVYAAFGEQAPQRGGGGGGGQGQAGGGQQRGGEGRREGGEQRQRGGEQQVAEAAVAAPSATLQQIVDAAMAQVPDWKSISLPLRSRGDHVDVQVVSKSTERRPPSRTLEVSTMDARIIKDPGVEAQATQTAGQKARSWFRRAHTGEQYGVIGQTIAGVASLAACFLVYTGLALAWRRLIKPLYRRA